MKQAVAYTWGGGCCAFLGSGVGTEVCVAQLYHRGLGGGGENVFVPEVCPSGYPRCGGVGAGRGGSASVCVVLGPQGVSVPGQPALPLALQPVKGLGFVTEATVAPSHLASR